MRAIVIDPPSTWRVCDLAEDDLLVILGRSPARIHLSPRTIIDTSPCLTAAPNPLASALLPTLGHALIHLRGTAVIHSVNEIEISDGAILTLSRLLTSLAANDVLLSAHTAAIALTTQWLTSAAGTGPSDK